MPVDELPQVVHQQRTAYRLPTHDLTVMPREPPIAKAIRAASAISGARKMLIDNFMEQGRRDCWLGHRPFTAEDRDRYPGRLRATGRALAGGGRWPPTGCEGDGQPIRFGGGRHHVRLVGIRRSGLLSSTGCEHPSRKREDRVRVPEEALRVAGSPGQSSWLLPSGYGVRVPGDPLSPEVLPAARPTVTREDQVRVLVGEL